MSETSDAKPVTPAEPPEPAARADLREPAAPVGRPEPEVVADPLDVGASAWRSVVLRQARRLSDELTHLEDGQLAAPDGAVAAEVSQRIDHAVGIARAPVMWGTRWSTLRNWWTGNGVETAWDDLQSAREKLLLIEPSNQVRAQVPALARRLVGSSPDPAHDPQVDQLNSIAATTGELSGDQRAQIAAAHAHVTAVTNDHSAARLFRNNLLLWTAGLAVGALALAGITSHGFRYVLVGALAGLLTTAVAWRSLTHLTGPYSVSTGQAVLKVSAGAASGLLGVLLVRSGIISGLSVSSSVAYGYAIVFGFSQQAFTQAVDGAAKQLGSS